VSSTNALKDYKQSPSKEYRFFLYCPNDGLTFWRTEEERNKEAASVIDDHLDDDIGWSDEVTGVVAGAVTHQAVETDVKNRVGELDEDGCDEVGEYWHNNDFTHQCNYALRPFPTPPAAPDLMTLCQELLKAIDENVTGLVSEARFFAVTDRVSSALATPPPPPLEPRGCPLPGACGCPTAPIVPPELIRALELAAEALTEPGLELSLRAIHQVTHIRRALERWRDHATTPAPPTLTETLQ
jgi:hypothetical protein